MGTNVQFLLFLPFFSFYFFLNLHFEKQLQQLSGRFLASFVSNSFWISFFKIRLFDPLNSFLSRFPQLSDSISSLFIFLQITIFHLISFVLLQFHLYVLTILLLLFQLSLLVQHHLVESLT